MGINRDILWPIDNVWPREKKELADFLEGYLSFRGTQNFYEGNMILRNPEADNWYVSKVVLKKN